MGANPKPPLDLSYVTIGVLTALEKEYAAALDVFDENRKGNECEGDALSGKITCWLCRVNSCRTDGEHIVAITLLPDMGNNAAAVTASNILQHCPSMRYLIMSGIAGAVPDPDVTEDHVRLGDIVVSNAQGIIQYDRGKQRDPLSMQSSTDEDRNSSLDPLAGFEFRPPPRPPGVDLLNAVRRMHADEESLGRLEYREWEKKVQCFFEQCKNIEDWKRPHSRKDRLNDSPDGKGADMTHPNDNLRRSIKRAPQPRVFRGPIGAGNIVLGDPNLRNALRNRHKVRAIEMEGSGIADASWIANIGYIVVRGTCDYCNSLKDNTWHRYAALIAACYSKTIIEYLHPCPISEDADLQRTREAFNSLNVVEGQPIRGGSIFQSLV